MTVQFTCVLCLGETYNGDVEITYACVVGNKTHNMVLDPPMETNQTSPNSEPDICSINHGHHVMTSFNEDDMIELCQLLTPPCVRLVNYSISDESSHGLSDVSILKVSKSGQK